MNGTLFNPDWSSSGMWTTDPPPSPDAPAPVTCDLPCVGKVFYLPQVIGHPWWVCAWEKVIRYRTEGRHGGGYYEHWIPGQYTTTKQTVFERGFTVPPTLYFPESPGGGSGCWNFAGTINPPSFGNNHVYEHVQTMGGYYHDSLGFAFTPCLTQAESDDLWLNHIYPAWSRSLEPERWVEWDYISWYYAEMSERLPPIPGSLVPMYAGSMFMFGAFSGMSGDGGSSGQMGVLLSPILAAIAAIEIASSASAAGGGRIRETLDNAEGYESAL